MFVCALQAEDAKEAVCRWRRNMSSIGLPWQEPGNLLDDMCLPTMM